MADGVLLDWEGVLADTRGARRDALRAALAAEGLALDESIGADVPMELSFEGAAVRAAGGLADPTLVDLIAMRARRELAARLAQGFAMNVAATRFVEGAQLRGPVVVVTAAGRAETEAALRLAGLLDSFAAIVTADEVSDAPSRDAFERAIAHLERRRPVRRERSIVLATTRPALRAARECGLLAVAVGAPAHLAVEADAAIASLDGATVDALDALLRGASGRPA
jgi:beta-phosphoglucomutase-like phosphatase (HAD superfamily)